MKTEFTNLSFDIIRYSMVWEGAATLLNGLKPTKGDHVLVITSGGCNVLNMLLEENEKVIAVDLNPLQNSLLRLKMHIISHHSYETFRALLGFDGKDAVKEAADKVVASLPMDQTTYWQSLFSRYLDGLLLSGKLEAYITSFKNELSDHQQELMNNLFDCRTIEEQLGCFNLLLQTDFKEKFINYFDNKQLRKGRDEKLFKYAKETGGLTFFMRLENFLNYHLLSTSFISRFFFYGPAYMPESLRPRCYQSANYHKLREAIHKLTIHTGEAIDYLFSEEGATVNKASLSNIFEYTSPETFEETVGNLLNNRQQPIRFLYWNLLNDQGGSLKQLPSYHAEFSRKLSVQEDCFYFDSVHLFQTQH